MVLKVGGDQNFDICGTLQQLGVVSAQVED